MICGVFLTSAIFAQRFDWAKQYGINSTFTGLSIVSDPQGNIYFTGSFSGSGDQDPSPATFTLGSNGSGDVFVAKLDPSGNLVWARSFGAARADVGTAIRLDAAGNVYVAGNFRDIVDFDPGPGTYTLQSPVYQSIWDSDAFLVKFDNAGNFVWAGSITGERDEVITGMTILNNKIYVSGVFGGVADFDMKMATTHTLSGAEWAQGFVATYDLNGDLGWVSMINGDSRAEAISLDAAGNIYATGTFSATTDFDPSSGTSNLTSAGGLDIFVWKLNSSGALVWARSMGGTNHDYVTTLVADMSGVYVSGYFQGTADFDPGSGSQMFTTVPGSDPRDVGTDLFVMKLSASGDYMWAKAIGDLGFEHGETLALDISGNVYLGGIFTYTVDFDPTYNKAMLISPNPYDEIFIMKMDAAGNLLWLGQIVGDKHDRIGEIYISSDNSIYLTGNFMENADLDPTSTVYMQAANGVTSGFVIKLNGTLAAVVSGIGETTRTAFSIYPNPSNGNITIVTPGKGADMTIYNTMGAVEYQGKVDPGINSISTPLAPGVYFVELSGQVSKLVIE
jgi:hypothetical protein